tara:strand:+ start:1363 stop:1875 length:513 start_codon:yes stop_codon:yes gene_type:complete
MIFLGVGSNLPSSFGDRFKNIELAATYLQSNQIKILKKSSFYETPSYPDRKNPKFINVIFEISTNLKLEDLISVIISIEEKLERKRNNKNDPRTCDIDIIDYDGQILSFKYKKLDFIIPHDKLSIRNFVLFPLKEIAPKWIHPETNDSVEKLIDNLSKEDKNSILKIKKP